LAQVVAPGHSNHVVQQGDRRLSTFFCGQDCWLYLRLMMCDKFNAEIWVYCSMTNHVHQTAKPQEAWAEAEIEMIESIKNRLLISKVSPKFPQTRTPGFILK